MSQRPSATPPPFKRYRRIRRTATLLLMLGNSASLFCGCGNINEGIPLPARTAMLENGGDYELVTRFVHVSDTHVVDEESPARLTGAQFITPTAWRPWEAYSTQIFDGIVRSINNIHAAGLPIDFVIHTGDACDNVHSIELDWFLNIWDGLEVNPRTGPDDRPPDTLPDPLLDQHAPFLPQGIYRSDIHGPLPSIPWYVVFGNHDVYAVGTLPILESLHGARFAPLPLNGRPGVLIPTVLDPLSPFSHGRITPAMPDAAPALVFESYIPTNPERAYFSRREFIRAMFTTITEPAGHGFEDPDSGSSWYSRLITPGVRLIGLDTCDHPVTVTATPQHEGAISERQLAFLKRELRAADNSGDIVIVASHHPSSTLNPWYGSAILADEFRQLLNDHQSVLLHLSGHLHRNRVWDRDRYWEIETSATIDLPQEARLIEIYRNRADGSLAVTYEMFSHTDDRYPLLNADPLRPMRDIAFGLAVNDASRRPRGSEGRQDNTPSDDDPAGEENDRQGVLTRPVHSAGQ